MTNVARPRLIGTATPLLTVNLLDGKGNTLATGTANASGSYMLTPISFLPNGVSALSVVSVDIAGNVSVPSPALTLTILTTPPVAPSAITLLASDDSGTLGDAITNVAQPRLIGTATAFASVTILDAYENSLGQGTAGANGSFQIKLVAPLPQGVTSLHARVIDPAGNTSPDGPSFLLTILTTPPIAPTVGLDPLDATGTNIAKTGKPRLMGVAPSGDLVELIDATGKIDRHDNGCDSERDVHHCHERSHRRHLQLYREGRRRGGKCQSGQCGGDVPDTDRRGRLRRRPSGRHGDL